MKCKAREIQEDAMKFALTRSILTIALVIVAQQALAEAISAPSVEAILANPKVVKTLEDIKADDERALAEQKRITEIPSPPYKEKVRAEYFQKRGRRPAEAPGVGASRHGIP
jgi:hypothetical protein